MVDCAAQILPLPAEVVAQIKSSTAITSLSGVIIGLVENSLDARARKIEISVDFRRGQCSVEDDGSGIPPLEFSSNGGLGKPYRKLLNLVQNLDSFDRTRYVKEQMFKQGSRRRRNLSIFVGCTLCFNNNIPSSRVQLACFSDFTSFQTCCKASASSCVSPPFKS